MNRRCIPFFILLLLLPVHAQENLLKNGDFSDSSGANWLFTTYNAQATNKIELGRYIISITKSGNQESAPQLSQRGFKLENGEGYTLSFKISGQATGYIKVAIENDGGITFDDTNSLKIPVTMTMTTHSIKFFVQHSTENTRLLFNCGISDSLTRIALDSVALQKSATPIIRITTPSAESRWVAGVERQIVWQNSGILEKVNIRFSPDSGKTWSAITTAASNQESYWWKVPAATGGSTCLIIISDTTGSSADTSAPFRIVPAGTIDRMEIVKNGDFLDTTDWRFNVNGGAKARGSFSEDEFIIKIDNAGTQPWHVKLEQPGFTLENGCMYRFSYDAYASHPWKLYANVGAENGNPAWSIFGGDTIPVDLDTGKKRFTHMIAMKYPTSSNIRVEFNCSTDTGTIHIDNVSLLQVEAADAFILSPSLGQVLKWGTKFDVEWQAAKVTTVDLDYSIDSGKTWAVIFEGVENLGGFAWDVPGQSSERCFIRIRTATSDSVLGMSAMFQINKFGTIIKAGEMVTNGSFTNNQQGWNTSFDNAQGQTNFKNQRFDIAISEPGNDPSSIILSQSGLTLLGNREYTFSFEAFANGVRNLGVVLVTEDTMHLFDTTLALPSVNEQRAFKFTPEKDVIARLEFRMGATRVGVFIDNVSLFTGPDPREIGVTTALRRTAEVVPFGFRPISGGVLFVAPRGGLIAIYTLQGALLRTLPASSEFVVWDGRNQYGTTVAKGNYVATLTGVKTRICTTFVLR